MKKLIISLALAGLSVGAFAQSGAPTYTPVTLALSSTYPAVNTNLASPPVMFVGKQQNVAIQFTFANSAAGTTNVTFQIQRSVDNVNYDSVVYNITGTPTGATPVTITTNIATGGFGYLRLAGISNAVALLPLSNVVVVYGLKISSP